MKNNNIYEKYLESVIKTAKKAGAEVLKFYGKGKDELKIKVKPDGSFVTIADLVANEVIIKELERFDPSIPILSEEMPVPSYTERALWKKYWLVDPLDGTSEFIQANGQFSVNIALIDNCKPVLGVSYMPTEDICYFACEGFGAFKEEKNYQYQLYTKKIIDAKIKVILSANNGHDELKSILSVLPDYELVYYSSSLKLCLVADGKADFYPRYGYNYEWDTAAGHCILEQAGGILIDFNWQELKYNAQESLESPPFFAIGDPSFRWKEYLDSAKKV